jgi:hypothetical protein
MAQLPQLLYWCNGTIIGAVVSCEQCHQLVMTELSLLIDGEAEQHCVPIQSGLFDVDAARGGALEPHTCRLEASSNQTHRDQRDTPRPRS